MNEEDKKELEKLRGTRIINIEGVLPTFYFDNNATLFLECPWRLVAHNETIIVGNTEFEGQSTHDEGMNILKDKVISKKIVDFEIKDGLYDIQITFENSLRLDIFVQSAYYESWNLHIGQRNFITIPGGQLAIF
ncbi:MAG: hypothetical protein JNJ75_15530 [Cyclobacteriaceae bacterium]|nr:hypothetical protein [Cyclobacteriaceae bacterium]